RLARTHRVCTGRAAALEIGNRSSTEMAATGLAALDADCHPAPGCDLPGIDSGRLSAGAGVSHCLYEFLVGPAMTVVGVGIDLADLARDRRLLADKGDQAMHRFFSDAERSYLGTRPDATGHAAARIAAKEAVYKAMQSLPGARAVGWREIEVTRDEEGRPAILLHGLAARLAEEQGGVHIQVSLTHSSLSAGAVAVVSAP